MDIGALIEVSRFIQDSLTVFSSSDVLRGILMQSISSLVKPSPALPDTRRSAQNNFLIPFDTKQLVLLWVLMDQNH